MPALTGAPTILVFHSSAKISGAKVKKYTTASEKGLSVYEDGWASPSGVKLLASPSLRGSPTSAGPSSSKRQRVEPFTTNPAAAGVIVAPPKRKRKPVRKIDLDKNMYFEDGITNLQEPEWLSDSEDEPSDTSSLSAPPASPKEPSPFRDPTPEDLEYGRNFASYYILADDDDQNDKGKKSATAPPVKAPRPSKKPEVSRQQPQGHPSQTPYYPPPQAQPPPQNPRSRARPASTRPPPPPPQQLLPPVPPPRVNIIDNIKRNTNPNKTFTAAQMIAKLDILSLALVKFGGTPPPQEAQDRIAQAARNSSVAASAKGGAAKPAANGQGDETVTGLLNLFDDDGNSDMTDDDGGAEVEESQDDKDLNYTLPTTGIPDTDLSYGIQFIMNALMTWAKQRIDAMYTQQWHQYNDMVRQQQQQQHSQPKKSRGRSKRDEVDQSAQVPQQPAPPSVVNAELTNTPEGEAVQAFQDVVDSGVLKVNTIMPKELTRTLGTLYVQIDHLINNSAREESRWQCMSYQAQIKAHNNKVQRWKEQMAKMQEEMSRQQELSHQQMMMQMGVPPHMQHRGSMSQQQAFRHHDMDLELKRSGKDAQNQPHLKQYLATPMNIDNRRARPSVVPSSSASPANGDAGVVPPQRVNSAMLQHGAPARDPMSHVTMYHDGRPANVAPEHIAQLQMRSGAGMKFSFEHNNEAARQLFGNQAFPSSTGASNIPRRGPMGRPDHAVNGHMPTPVLGSNAPPLNGYPKPGETSNVNGGKAIPAAASPGTVGVTMDRVKDAIVQHSNGNREGISTKTTDRASETPAAPSASSPTKSPDNGRKRKHSETVNASASSASRSASTAPSDPGKFKLRLSGRTRSSNGSASKDLSD